MHACFPFRCGLAELTPSAAPPSGPADARRAEAEVEVEVEGRGFCVCGFGKTRYPGNGLVDAETVGGWLMGWVGR
jgi:hypothetical protein